MKRKNIVSNLLNIFEIYENAKQSKESDILNPFEIFSD